MENPSGEHPSEQGQQVSAQSARTRPAPTAEQLAEFAASHHQTGQKRRAPETFAVEEEAPARRTQAPQSTGVHNQRFLAISPSDQSHPVLPAISASLPASNQEGSHLQPVTSALTTNMDLREQLREEIQKEMEILCSSRLAKRTFEVETFWRAKLEERTKEVEKYWEPKLAEALSNSRNDKTRDLHEEIEKLKMRLEKGPGLIKAAEERGRRQGELDGYNELSLNPDLKPSQDRLNFDFLIKEKDKEIAGMKTARENWFRDARKYSEDTNATLRARDQEIQRLRAQLEHPPLQQPLAPDHTDALMAEGRDLQARFDNQTQELVSLQQKCNQQGNDLANLTARSDRESQISSDREQQLGAQLAELSANSDELVKKTNEVSILRRESDQKAVELSDSNEELERMSGEIKGLREGRRQDSEELEKCKQQVEEQSKEIASLQTGHSDSESSNQEKDRRIASLQELLDNPSPRQSDNSKQEEIELLKRQLAENESLLNEARSEIISLRDHQARSELEDLSATSETDNVARTEADKEFVRTILEKERVKNEAANSSRENRVNATLEGLERRERERRQMLIDELERKDAQLYNAQKKIGELEQQLLASSSQSPTSSLNTLPPSPISASPPLPPALPSLAATPSPSPAAASSPSFQRLRFPGAQSLFIVILIFLLAISVPYLQSLANWGSEHELVGSASRDDRMRWEAWELANRERNEGVPTYQESWRRTQEVGQMGDWDP